MIKVASQITSKESNIKHRDGGTASKNDHLYIILISHLVSFRLGRTLFEILHTFGASVNPATVHSLTTAKLTMKNIIMMKQTPTILMNGMMYTL